jgi:hypothetical protein
MKSIVIKAVATSMAAGVLLAALVACNPAPELKVVDIRLDLDDPICQKNQEGKWTYGKDTNTWTIVDKARVHIGARPDDVNTTCATTTGRIVVSEGSTVEIKLDNATIDLSGSIVPACAFDMDGATVHLTLIGNSTLKSTGDAAGLQCSGGAASMSTTAYSKGLSTLTIDGTGSLTVSSGSETLQGLGAGIGGVNGKAGGTITINSGTILADNSVNNNGGAGIGGGAGGQGGTITISPAAVATVTAKGGVGAENIGGGAGAPP